MKDLTRKLSSAGKVIARKATPYLLAASALVPFANNSYAQSPTGYQPKVEMASPIRRMPKVTLQSSQYVTGPTAFDYTPIVSEDTNQNCYNVQAAARDVPEGGIVHLPPAIYDLSEGANNLGLTWKRNVIFRGTTNPIPENYLEARDYPTTGTIFKVAVSLNYPSQTLENIIFKIDPSDPNPPLHFVQIMENNITIKNCYLIDNPSVSGERAAISLARGSNISSASINGCYIRDFTYGATIGDNNSKWRGNIFNGNRYAVMADAGADLGRNTPGEEGENVFVVKGTTPVSGVQLRLSASDDRIAYIYGGSDYPIQENYYYVEDTEGKLTQLKTEEEVSPYITDNRTPTGGVRLQSYGADVLIPPIQQSPHYLFPTASGVRRSELYE